MRAGEVQHLLCHQCHKHGHTAAGCNFGHRCSKSAGQHGSMACTSETPKCVHCGKVHEATSPVCSAISSEKQITRLDLEHPLHILRPAPHSELPRRRPPVRKFLGVRGISNLYDRQHQAFFLLLQLNHRLNRTSFFYVQRMSLRINRQL